MVRGLEVFREHFAGREHQYVLIGGGACDLLFGQSGLEFRATKDFDMVLCVEALDPEAGFMDLIWDFVQKGGYEVREKGQDRKLYRFAKPKDVRYPKQLELFSRLPAGMDLAAGAHLTPIPGDEATSSLSAILMDEVSYRFLVEGTTTIGGVRLATETRLIALKARAWKEIGERSLWQHHDVAKHRQDIYLLGTLLKAATKTTLPPELAAPLLEWLEKESAPQGAQTLPTLPPGVQASDIRQAIRTAFF